MEQFEGFRFSVLTVSLGKGILGTSVEGTVPVSVPEKRFRGFWFLPCPFLFSAKGKENHQKKDFLFLARP